MLDELIQNHIRLTEVHRKALNKLKIKTVRDLLYHFPTRYEYSGDEKTISGVTQGTDAILYGTLKNPETRKAWKSKRPMGEAWLHDGTGRIKLMWFNQPYMAKKFVDGASVKVTGRIEGKTSPYVANPEIELVETLPVALSDTVFSASQSEHELYAVYPETIGISSRWFRHTLSKILTEKTLSFCTDPIPEHILSKYSLPSLKTALVWIHKPKNDKNVQAAKKRFAFEEIFLIQLAKQSIRHDLNTLPTYSITKGKEHVQDFLKTLPFSLTQGQESALQAILHDMSSSPSMSRLLEGDVGSGKTVVAAGSAYAVINTSPPRRPSAKLQVAYMAPTEILAEQHFASFVSFFKHLPISIGLLTSGTCKKFPSKVSKDATTKISKAQLLKWVEQGEISVLIGTHALIQKSVQFRDLGLVIIDEQHRFGTMQRQTLAKKENIIPHLLSMTATPIPRTLALTMYGDLDLTVLDEMPPGRKKVITKIIGSTERLGMYEEIRKELARGKQVYVICPRIDEPDPKKADALMTRSVKAETEQLRMKEFRGYRVDMLHGQMKPSEKEETMRAFLNHDVDVLVATSVIEVGVNVPNATIIIIEGAERFGLSQLHQLRGRVVRSSEQAYCYVLSTDGNATMRLKALERAKNGFELAEYDLKLRGPGELYGRSQSGLSDIGMEALKNIKMVEAARVEAQNILETHSSLREYPALQDALTLRKEKLHFE